MAKLNKRQQVLLKKMPKDQRIRLLKSLGDMPDEWGPEEPSKNAPAKPAEHEPARPKAEVGSTFGRSSAPKRSGLSSSLSVMIQSNPFNVLGLLAGTPEKEIARRKAQVNAYLNVGKDLHFEEDIPLAIEGVERTKDNVASAFAAIDQYRSRALHGFSWFMEVSRADGPGLAHLRAGDVGKAQDIWYRVAAMGDLTEQSISCASNLGTLAFLTGADNMETLTVGLNWKIKVLESPLFPTLLERIGDSTTAKDPSAFSRAWANQLASWLIPLYGGQPAAMHKLSDSLDRATEDTAGLLRQPFEEHYAKELERLVAQCATKRKADKPDAHLAGKNLLTSSKLLTAPFKVFTRTRSMVYQHAVDLVSEELLECAITHWNIHQDDDTIDTKTVKQLVTHSKSLAAGRMLVARIEDNWSTMLEYLQGEDDRKRLADISPVLVDLRVILDGFDGDHSDLDDIAGFILRVQHELEKVKQHLGEQNDVYIDVSSACVGKAQGALVKVVNEAQERISFDITSRLQLPRKLQRALELQKRLSGMAMRTELRTHFNKNLSVLKDLVDQVAPQGASARPSGSGTRPGSGYPSGGSSSTRTPSSAPPRQVAPTHSEPGWVERNAISIVIFVVIGIFLAVCNN